MLDTRGTTGIRLAASHSMKMLTATDGSSYAMARAVVRFRGCLRQSARGPQTHDVNQIFEILHRIAPEADVHRLEPNESLREALDIDSFYFLNVLVGINEKLGVNIPEADYRRVSTLKGITEYLGKRMH